MKIPNKAYDTLLIPQSGKVDYYPRKYSENMKTLRLPKWLVKEIQEVIVEAEERGKAIAINKIRVGLEEVLRS